MNQFKKFTVEVERQQESYGGPYKEAKVWIRGERKERSDGINHLSFLLIGNEWKVLFRQGGQTLADGYRILQTCGQLWTFVALDQIPLGEAGIAPLHYLRMIAPYDVRKMIAADIEAALIKFDESEPGKYGSKDAIVMDYTDRLEEWSRDYGQGKGQVEIEANSETRDLLGKFSGEETFDGSWERITAIARNQTHKKTDVGIVRINRDHGGFFWSVPGSMHGGLINHGSEEKPDWSVHT